MNIKDVLSQRISRPEMVEIVNHILIHPEKMPDLMKAFFSEEMRICQRAAWPVGIIGEKAPELVIPYMKKMFHAAKNPLHNAITRNTMRTFQFIDIPEDLESEVYNYCFNNICKPNTKLAVRAFGMTVATNIALKYPELKEELIAAIKEYIPIGSPGFKARGKREINRLINDKNKLL